MPVGSLSLGAGVGGQRALEQTILHPTRSGLDLDTLRIRGYAPNDRFGRRVVVVWVDECNHIVLRSYHPTTMAWVDYHL
jgi:hypothetical protein